MKTFTHVYVQRVDPTTVERMRIPITAEQTQTFMERGTLDALQSQTESTETAQDTVDDPFIFPQASQRLTIVAAARGMYATFHEYPHLEHDQDVLQEVNAEERETMVQGVRSMDNPAALIFLDQIIRARMQEMGVKTLYELL